MSPASKTLGELAERLGHSLSFTAGLLRQLEAGMKQRRTQWISAKAGDVAEAPAALERQAQELAAAEQLQQQLLADIAAVLPGPGPLPGKSMHVNVTRIAVALPKAAAARLRQQAADATKAAKAVHVEALLGDRLLRFSQQANDALVQRLVKVAHPVDGGTHGYDRRARAVHGNLVGSSAPTGSLIDGRL